MAREEQPAAATTGAGLQPGTLLRGGLAGAILVAAVGLVAWLGMDSRPDLPLDPYRRMGVTAGAAALQRDLLAEFPPGTPPARLVRKLEGMGLTCRPAATGWDCLQAAQGEGRRIWQAEVTVGLAAGAISLVAARFKEETR